MTRSQCYLSRLLAAILAILTLALSLTLQDRLSLPPEQPAPHGPYRYQAASQGYLSIPDQWWTESIDWETFEVRIKH